MDTLDGRCFQCGHEDVKSIRQCPQRAWQACPYAATPFDVSPSFIGYAWPDYMDIVINILLINIVLWLINIVILGRNIFNIGALALVFFEVRLFFWSAIILLVYSGFSKKSASQKNRFPTFLQPLQKRLTHYYRPADRRGFVVYERFGLTTLYGTTAIIPVPFTNSETHTDKYSPSFLSLVELTRINDFNQRMHAEIRLAPQIVRWTLLGLANQDLIQLSVVKLTRSDKNKKANRAIIFVTPKPNLLSYQATGLLENEFIKQLRQQADAKQDASHWGSVSVYKLVYNLYEQAISSPAHRLTTRLIDDAIAHGWADKAGTKDFKAKIKSLLVIPWQLTPNHDAKIMAEHKMFTTWDRAVKSEHKKFMLLMNTAVEKAMRARTRKNHG